MTDQSAILAGALWFVEGLSLLYLAYRGCLGLLGLRAPKHLPPGSGELRFLVLVPAHDEADVIGETVECILGLDYPRERVSLFVVADRCADGTEAIARAAGAQVLVKQDASSGKGITVQWALAHRLVTEGDWDALVIFDADS
ncbi:MAG TPA: glycosyltransferase, partial [Dehalococcoidia bacterium]|nr:glycosyltransferase [Dehalococcoidia bacterium]